jgi:hypothetical protein
MFIIVMYTAKSSLLISNTFVLIVSYLSAPLSLKNNAIKDEIKFGSGPEYVEARPPDGRILYVGNLWSPISVVDLTQSRVIKDIDPGTTPHFDRT